MPLSTTAAVFSSIRGLLGNVPTDPKIVVCPVCRGPVNPGFEVCYACERLLRSGPPVPSDLRSVVVPMTTAINPGQWYSRLLQYKRTRPEYRSSLLAVVESFLGGNRDRIRDLLAGRVDTIGVVPSKKGTAFSDQPLAQLLQKNRRLEKLTCNLLRVRAGASLGRWQYDPSIFQGGTESPEGRRVVLIEDTWVTGATCMSAAGALLDLGAKAVVVMPTARCIDKSWWSVSASDYLEAVRAPYEPAWPR